MYNANVWYRSVASVKDKKIYVNETVPNAKIVKYINSPNYYFYANKNHSYTSKAATWNNIIADTIYYYRPEEKKMKQYVVVREDGSGAGLIYNTFAEAEDSIDRMYRDGAIGTFYIAKTKAKYEKAKFERTML